jgi:ankyrin repeat protein
MGPAQSVEGQPRRLKMAGRSRRFRPGVLARVLPSIAVTGEVSQVLRDVIELMNYLLANDGKSRAMSVLSDLTGCGLPEALEAIEGRRVPALLKKNEAKISANADQLSNLKIRTLSNGIFETAPNELARLPYPSADQLPELLYQCTAKALNRSTSDGRELPLYSIIRECAVEFKSDFYFTVHPESALLKGIERSSMITTADGFVCSPQDGTALFAIAIGFGTVREFWARCVNNIGEWLQSRMSAIFLLWFDDSGASTSLYPPSECCMSVQGTEVFVLPLVFDIGPNLSYLRDYPSLRTYLEKIGHTPLMEAAGEGFFELLKLLVEEGHDVNAKDQDGRTALMRASENCSGENSPDVVELLIAQGAEVNSKDRDGKTALMRAAERSGANRATKVTKALLEGGANVNAKDNSGYSALHMVETTVVLVQLLDKGGDVNIREKSGTTLLTWFVDNAWYDWASLLVEKGADINARDIEGQTALMEACRPTLNDEEARIRFLKMLVDSGAEVNIENDRRETALIISARSGDVNSLRILLDKGANVAAKDEKGKTALVYAKGNGHLAAADLLLQHGAKS